MKSPTLLGHLSVWLVRCPTQTVFNLAFVSAFDEQRRLALKVGYRRRRDKDVYSVYVFNILFCLVFLNWNYSKSLGLSAKLFSITLNIKYIHKKQQWKLLKLKAQFISLSMQHNVHSFISRGTETLSVWLHIHSHQVDAVNQLVLLPDLCFTLLNVLQPTN